MSIQLNLSDLLYVLREMGSANTEGYKAALHGIADKMAEDIRNGLGIASMPADGADEDGGVMVGFYALNEQQQLPDDLVGLDPSGDWGIYDGIRPSELLLPVSV